MNTSSFQVDFLSFNRNISIQLVWEGLDVAGDIVAYTVNTKSNCEQLVCKFSIICDPVHKTYAQKCFSSFDAYNFHIEVSTSHQSRLLVPG